MSSQENSVLDLTEQNFLNISNVTGRIFEMGVQRSKVSISTDVCSNSVFLSSSMAGKHVWINASTAQDVTERLRHFHSAFVASPTSTSLVCWYKIVCLLLCRC